MAECDGVVYANYEAVHTRGESVSVRIRRNIESLCVVDDLSQISKA